MLNDKQFSAVYAIGKLRINDHHANTLARDVLRFNPIALEPQVLLRIFTLYNTGKFGLPIPNCQPKLFSDNQKVDN